MDIFTLPFEKALLLNINGELIKVIPFRTPEEGNIKFGVEASKNIKIHREEIYQAIKQQWQEMKEDN